MSMKTVNYENLLSLTGGDLSVLTDNTDEIAVAINDTKRFIINPLYEDRTTADPVYWLRLHFESDLLDLSLEPALVITLQPSLEAVDVLSLESPAITLTARDNNNQPTEHDVTLTMLFNEWTESLLEEDVLITKERPPVRFTL